MIDVCRKSARINFSLYFRFVFLVVVLIKLCKHESTLEINVSCWKLFFFCPNSKIIIDDRSEQKKWTLIWKQNKTLLLWGQSRARSAVCKHGEPCVNSFKRTESHQKTHHSKQHYKFICNWWFQFRLIEIHFHSPIVILPIYNSSRS